MERESVSEQPKETAPPRAPRAAPTPDTRHNKDCTESKQLYAGTTPCFKLVRDYFDGFGPKYDIVGGNHDLEGIDEFATDEENLEAYLPHPRQAQRAVLAPDRREDAARRPRLHRLPRRAKYTSHEVIIDDEQIKWFENLVASTHPAERRAGRSSSSRTRRRSAPGCACCRRTTSSTAAAG